jgi:histidinol dehydrogenase
MQIIKYPEKKDWIDLLKRPATHVSDLEGKVVKILKSVQKKGDKALRKYTKKFDGVRLNDIQAFEQEIMDAADQLSPELKEAIRLAASNIETFHRIQVQQAEWVVTMPGIMCSRKSVAIEKVGLYIPGGTAPLFSTVLMLGIPASLAKCKEIVLCSPPGTNGQIHPAILYAAQHVGITKIYKVGGVQAIAAMAYGTETIPKVYKIFGPGNQFVTCAKQMIQKAGVAIDMPAGPSEVAIFADEYADPAFIAADLLSQAEHGADSQVLLISDDEICVENVQFEIQKQLTELPRKNIAIRALANSKAIVVQNDEEAMELLNEYAPEHLILACNNCDEMAEKVRNAGSVFIGNYSPESVGDYASGTNHTLPTNGYAKAYSGVSVDSFVKKITYQKLSKEGLEQIGKTVELMAEAEGLLAHKNAVSIRLERLGTKQAS